jgi:phage tail sheath protein FI
MPTSVTYPGVYIEEVSSGVHPIPGVPTSITAFVGWASKGPLNEPTKIFSFAEYERIFGGLWRFSMMSYAVQHFFLNGGSVALIVRVGSKAGDGLSRNSEAATKVLNGDGRNKTGLHALEQADLFNLLCIPPLIWVGWTGTLHEEDVEGSTWNAAAHLCRNRRAFLLIDAPKNWTAATAANRVDAFRGVAAENAAIYFPRVRMADPLQENKPASFAPSGSVAGIISRTDAARGIWKAPAGLETYAIGAAVLSIALTDQETGTLNQLGINCLRTFPSSPRVLLWGARTLAGADSIGSEWKYIPVRRTALYIEESVYCGTKWVVFEPNGQPLWAQVRVNVVAFMQKLFQQRAFQGQKPNEAYFVKCDETTTTQADIDSGVVNILVGFAPLKPAEFVVIKIQQMAGRSRT